ncbi:N-acetylmuramoyl-L-alanine amidase [Streptomyces paromomycinus]|uniref:peptidoglycan recognition protein family protein n=1 Tax=Streptomyces paromomycinus TaxID=92743 RepID=UPI001FEB2AE0|nr:N-acetylmuramoyl-L-alanine amidase [Streptomyces paromomycinus]
MIYVVGFGCHSCGSGGSSGPASGDRRTVSAPGRQATKDGNARFYGLELVNRGTGTDPWPEVQLDAAVRWAAALCRLHGWTERSVIGRREWWHGKIEPGHRTRTSNQDFSDTL